MNKTQTQQEQPIRPLYKRRDQAPPGECAFCDRMRAEGRDWFPPHDASVNCHSGKRSHCSCDTCF